LLETLDGGEELEDHQEDKEESGQDDSVYVVLDTDQTRYGVADIRERYDDSHPAPDDDAYGELEECLATLMLEKILGPLTYHNEGEYDDDDLIECERHSCFMMMDYCALRR
jgi:hypothetical protein